MSLVFIPAVQVKRMPIDEKRQKLPFGGAPDKTGGPITRKFPEDTQLEPTQRKQEDI